MENCWLLCEMCVFCTICEFFVKKLARNATLSKHAHIHQTPPHINAHKRPYRHIQSIYFLVLFPYIIFTKNYSIMLNIDTSCGFLTSFLKRFRVNCLHNFWNKFHRFLKIKRKTQITQKMLFRYLSRGSNFIQTPHLH